MRISHSLTLALLVVAAALPAQQRPTPETADWWAETTALSSDAMEGRDTGTEAYERAAKYVATRFAAAGLRPAGDPVDGKPTFFQRVFMHETDLDLAHSSVEVLTPENPEQPDSPFRAAPLKLLEEVTLTPRPRVRSSSSGVMVFLGYGLPLPPAGQPFEGLKDLSSAIAVIYNNTPAGLSPEDTATFIARRNAALAASGVTVIVSIDNPAATEPTHWPAAYARTVDLVPSSRPNLSAPIQLRISAEAAPRLFAADPDHAFSTILADGERGLPLKSFRIHSGLKIEVQNIEKDISSPNVLAVLPGSDAKLAAEYVALSAHLDGYGFGTSVLGDSLYNGTLDDAAYVALLLQVAHNLHAKAPARSLLFCVFTGEEKGLLGSSWFTQDPTVPAAGIVADLNLDQLRPIFPLTILTMEGIADSTLGATVKTLADSFHIEVRPDREPERNLFRRADNYNFVRIGVPIASFIFGYNPGSAEEAIYRDWYARRYHKPQDDLATPIDWQAAATFNRFYQQLAVTIANASVRPAWLPASPYAPKPATSSPGEGN